MGKSKKQLAEVAVPAPVVVPAAQKKGKRALEEEEVVKPSKKLKVSEQDFKSKKKRPIPPKDSSSESEEEEVVTPSSRTNMAGNKNSSRYSPLKTKRCRAGPKLANVSSMKRVLDEISVVRQEVRQEMSAMRQQISAMGFRLDSVHLSSSAPSLYEHPSDYGLKLRATLGQADQSIVPMPLSSIAADLILPSFEICLGKEEGTRIHEADFREWMGFIREDRCTFQIQFSGNAFRTGRKTKNVDFVIVRKGKPLIDFHVAAMLALLSHDGKYNGDRELGEALTRAGTMLTTCRTKVIVGLTNGILVEWFSFKTGQGSPNFSTLRVSPIYPLRESLCGLLVADPSSLYLSFMDVPILGLGPQLGEGRTSLVFSASHEGQEVSAKLFKREYGCFFEREADILEQLKDVPGIPTIVVKDTDRKYFMMTPVGKSLASFGSKFVGRQHIVTQLVDILRSVHEKGIIHRDIRAPNILLVEGDTGQQVVLIDWGFACIAGAEEVFAGSVETGSNCLLRQLICKSRERHRLTGADMASRSGGVLTRSKAMLSANKEKASVMTKELTCCLGPGDDLVSLVKCFLLICSRSAKEELKKIASDDYQNYANAWCRIMEAHPLWKKAQDYAEQCKYEKVKDFLSETLVNFMS